jgi:hypothetical protein
MGVVPRRSSGKMRKRPVTARVDRWQGFGWGVALDDGDRRHDAYPVGPHEVAEAEATRCLRQGARARHARRLDMLSRKRPDWSRRLPGPLMLEHVECQTR